MDPARGGGACRDRRYCAGAVTPLGLLNDEERKVTLFLDADFGSGLVGVHPNDNTATVWLAAADLVQVIGEHGNKVNVVKIG